MIVRTKRRIKTSTWTAVGLVIWMSWVDDCIVCGEKQNVLAEKKKFTEQFDCDAVGELKEYIGCTIDYEPEKGQLKLMQPVLIQSTKERWAMVHTAYIHSKS